MYTHLIATINPISPLDEIIKLTDRLQLNGIYHYRFNFAKLSENSVSEITKILSKINYIGNKYEKVCITIDLPYPGKKFRINQETKVRKIKKNNKYLLRFNSLGYNFDNEINIGEKLEKIKWEINDVICYDMGQGQFQIKGIINENCLEVCAINNFEMYNRKSISFRNVIYEECYEILDLIGKNCYVEEIALSFVENINYLEKIKNLKNKYKFRIFSKIESRNAIDNIDIIASNSDGIILGRGDLCLYADFWRLYIYQEKAINICKQMKKPIYIATGFLESMQSYAIPKRSEIIDISVAIKEKAEGILLNAATVSSDNLETTVDCIRKIENSIDN